MRVAVLAGGVSSEREVSLRTGRAVAAALRNLGHATLEIDLGEKAVEQMLALQGEVDAAFLALHGRGGEDGTAQGTLELLGIPYTGSGVMSSAVAMDKNMTKLVLAVAGVPVVPGTFLRNEDIETLGLAEAAKRALADVGSPAIVKPNCEGSTVGISVVNDVEEMEEGLREALKFDPAIVIERFVPGRELTVGIVGKARTVLPVLEVVPKKGIYDYECKYEKGMTTYIVPADIPQAVAERVSELSLQAHNALGCEGISRIDFMLTGEELYCLEVNTIPGMTELSLVPKAAASMGISFDELVAMILETAALKSCTWLGRGARA
ncbi:MAG: D-alanine--D-alanine ligase [Candidatus Geothermincolia bacterium]